MTPKSIIMVFCLFGLSFAERIPGRKIDLAEKNDDEAEVIKTRIATNNNDGGENDNVNTRFYQGNNDYVPGGHLSYPGTNNNNNVQYPGSNSNYPNNYPNNNNGINYPDNYYPGTNGGNNNGNSNSEVIAFSAVRASRYTQSSPAEIKFERTLTDVGYGWDPKTSRFVAYAPGLYVFAWSAVSPSYSEFRLSLMKNGREVAHAWSEKSGYQSGSNTVVLNLRVNDQVSLKVTEGKIYEPTGANGRGYTTFTGYKLN